LIQNIGNGLCMQPVDNSGVPGTPVVQVSCDFNTGTGPLNLGQEWLLDCTSSSCATFHVINIGTGLCLDARGGATNGTPIQIWTCNTITNENWDFGPSSGTGFVLRSRVSGTTSTCLDVPGAQATIGLALQLWQCNGTVAQRWQAVSPVNPV
jgi:hypothetical protein